MSFVDVVNKMWVLERHPKGALSVKPAMEVLERNYYRWIDKKDDPTWEVLGLFPSFESALEGQRTLKRRYATIHKNEREDKHEGHGEIPVDPAGDSAGQGSAQTEQER